MKSAQAPPSDTGGCRRGFYYGPQGLAGCDAATLQAAAGSRGEPGRLCAGFGGGRPGCSPCLVTTATSNARRVCNQPTFTCQRARSAPLRWQSRGLRGWRRKFRVRFVNQGPPARSGRRTGHAVVRAEVPEGLHPSLLHCSRLRRGSASAEAKRQKPPPD